MTPKKAIIFLLVLLLAIAIFFVFLYANFWLTVNQPNLPPDENGLGNSAVSANRPEPSSSAEKAREIENMTSRQIEQIVEQGKAANGGLTPEAQQKIDEAVYQEILEKMKLKTPEQLQADEQRRAEQKARDEQINAQIMGQLQAE